MHETDTDVTHERPRRIALVTGANQGVGRQVATELATLGFTVLVGSRDAGRGQEAADAIGDRAIPLQLDVTDAVSIAAAAERIGREFSRLDLLIQNAAISHFGRQPGASVADHAKLTRPSNVSMAEMRAVWDTNVFGVLAVHQAMLPLLRRSSDARIVIVSSSAGSLSQNSDPANEHRALFGPVYPASKTALNALVVAMANELEPEGIPVNAVSPGFVRTNLNGYAGTETLEYGAREIVRVALVGSKGPTGRLTRWQDETIPW